MKDQDNLTPLKDRLSNDKEFIKLLITDCYNRYDCEYITISAYQKELEGIFGYASENIKQDKEFAFDIINLIDISLIQYFLPDLRKDKEFIEKFANKKPWRFQIADKELRSDREYVFELIKKGLQILQYASPDLAKDKDLSFFAEKGHLAILEPINQDTDAIKSFTLKTFIGDKIKEINYSFVAESLADKLKNIWNYNPKETFCINYQEVVGDPIDLKELFLKTREYLETKPCWQVILEYLAPSCIASLSQDKNPDVEKFQELQLLIVDDVNNMIIDCNMADYLIPANLTQGIKGTPLSNLNNREQIV